MMLAKEKPTEIVVCDYARECHMSLCVNHIAMQLSDYYTEFKREDWDRLY